MIRKRRFVLAIILSLLFATTIQAKQGDRFRLLTNGKVKDSKTGLEWKAGPGRDMTWNLARAWVKSLKRDDVGWRMPSIDELKGLFEEGMGSHNLSPLLLNTTLDRLSVWSGKTEGDSKARLFIFKSELFGFITFMNGKSIREYKSKSSGNRAFAVRSRGDG